MLSRLATTCCLLFALAACTSSIERPPVTSPSPSPSSSAIVWKDCTPTPFQCGTLTVPLDYAHAADGRTLSLALVRLPVTNPSSRLGSLLTNPGGPGASGIQYLHDAASSLTHLNTRFDLIGFDPRGVGASTPVRCLSGPQEDAFNALDSVLDDPQEKLAAINAAKDFAAGCSNLSGSVLPFVDTPSAARDMDQIRIALGDAKLTYLGFSYGTLLGQMYAHLFPTHVRALALDGVVDPTLSANDMLLAQLVGFEANFQAFLTDCRTRKAASPSPCAYAASGDPSTKLTALMNRLDVTPMPAGPRLLTRSLAATGVLLGFYSQSFWPTLDQALTATDNGNGAPLLRLADIYLARNADGTYDNETDANWAINCLDHPVSHDVASYDALASTYASASPLFGPFFQYSNLGCAYWPVPPTGTAGPLRADGASPILLVGGTNDPATPYAWAVSVNQQLANSVLLTRQGNGHTSYDASPKCQAAIDAYLISLTLPSQGATC